MDEVVQRCRRTGDEVIKLHFRQRGLRPAGVGVTEGEAGATGAARGGEYSSA
jgi:hypothetical protein